MYRRHRIILIIAAVVVVVGLVGIQFIPTGFDLEEPAVTLEPNWDSTETRALVQRACYDCHAYETSWPWYSKIAPFSWALQYDIQTGIEALNFSAWDEQEFTQEDLDYMIELIGKNQMPLSYYLILHPEAALSEREKGQMINGMIATFTDFETPMDVLDEEAANNAAAVDQVQNTQGSAP